jgi:protein-disulfide isomerase
LCERYKNKKTRSVRPPPQALKWHVRSHRKAGVHVTPTVYVNGIEAVQVSSGWDADEWALFLDEQLE